MAPAAVALTVCAAALSAAVGGCAPAADPPAPRHGALVDGTARTLVITAMQSELDAVLAHARLDAREVVAGRTYHLGEISGVPVVAMASGMSMVNAAISAQEALHHFEIERIVVSGIAGGPNPGLGIGDVTIPAQWAQYQEHAFTENERWSDGLGRFGMMHPQLVEVTTVETVDSDEERFWFPVDADLLTVATGLAASELDLARCNRNGDCARDDEPRLVVGGNGVSGPTFVDHAEYTAWVWETFSPDVLEMETAAFAHVAYTSGVPYIAVRAISDLAGGNPENLVGSYGRMAARNAAAVTAALLDGMRKREGRS